MGKSQIHSITKTSLQLEFWFGLGCLRPNLCGFLALRCRRFKQKVLSDDIFLFHFSFSAPVLIATCSAKASLPPLIYLPAFSLSSCNTWHFCLSNCSSLIAARIPVHPFTHAPYPPPFSAVWKPVASSPSAALADCQFFHTARLGSELHSHVKFPGLPVREGFRALSFTQEGPPSARRPAAFTTRCVAPPPLANIRALLVQHTKSVE